MKGVFGLLLCICCDGVWIFLVVFVIMVALILSFVFECFAFTLKYAINDEY